MIVALANSEHARLRIFSSSKNKFLLG